MVETSGKVRYAPPVTVYTYLHNREDVRKHSPSLLRQIDYWRKSWSVRGWTPVVLNEAVASVYPDFPQIDRIVSTYPTVNAPYYERACFLRWVALAQMGGGLMTDYDTVNNSFTPTNLQTLLEKNNQPPVLGLCPGRTPCCVYASDAGARQMLDWFIDPAVVAGATVSEGGRPHVSDQSVFHSLTQVPTEPVSFGYDGNPARPVWHVSTGCAHSLREDKTLLIGRLTRQAITK